MPFSHGLREISAEQRNGNVPFQRFLQAQSRFEIDDLRSSASLRPSLLWEQIYVDEGSGLSNTNGPSAFALLVAMDEPHENKAQGIADELDVAKL